MLHHSSIAVSPGLPVRESSRWRGLLPREHGSWAFVLEPLLLAVLVAPSWRAVAFTGTALALFLARRPWHVARASRAADRRADAHVVLATLVVVGAGCGAFALIPFRPAVVTPLGIAAIGAMVFAWQDQRRCGRGVVAECAGALVFAALAAVAVLCGSGDGASRVLAWAVAGFAAVRSLTSILPIRAYVRQRKGEPAGAAGAWLATIVSLIAGVIAVQVMGTWVPLAWSAVFALRTAWVLGPWKPDWPARRIGVLEMAVGLAAILTTGIAFL